MRYFFIIFFTLLTSVFAASTTINAGIYENKPLSYINVDTKEANGLFIDILKFISKKENIDINFVPCQFSECLEFLESKKIDILGPIAYSQKRAKKFLFLDEEVLSSWGSSLLKKNVKY